MIKKILFVTLLFLFGATLLTLLLKLFGMDTSLYFVPVMGLFLIVWGIKTSRCWYVGESIGLRAGLEIPKDASKLIRLIGLVFALFTITIGVLALHQHFSTMY